MIQHILIPVDFSTTSEAAVEYGFALAADIGARVTLLHVLTPGVIALPEATYVPTEDERRQLVGATRAQLQALAFRRVRAGVHVSCVVVEGEPAETIRAFASAHEVDVIIMGTHGRRGLLHFILGSVAERVLRSAACPVLTVGHEARHAGATAVAL
jgi:nucleotide-binding universal stress UspA family protein